MQDDEIESATAIRTPPPALLLLSWRYILKCFLQGKISEFRILLVNQVSVRTTMSALDESIIEHKSSFLGTTLLILVNRTETLSRGKG